MQAEPSDRRVCVALACVAPAGYRGRVRNPVVLVLSWQWPQFGWNLHTYLTAAGQRGTLGVFLEWI